MLGKLLQGRYQVVQVLSIGEFCQTYLAQDTHLDSRLNCVVKHFQPNSNYTDLQTLRQLFTREVQALRKLSNYDQVPELLDYFEDNQEFYLVRKFIEGHTLSAELQGYHWTENQVIQLLQEILEILEFVHAQGLIHRDIKPSNIIRRQHDDRLMLIDFGSVKQIWRQVAITQGQTSAALGIPATIAIGTPGYMPTEQGRGRPRSSSDIYALGIIAIQALTGLHPDQLLEDPDTGELMWQHQKRVSSGLAYVINKMVRYHFKDRYQSAQEALQALQQLASFYLPPQQSVSLASVTSKQMPESPVSEQATLPPNTLSKPLLDEQASEVSVHPNKSALLIGIGIGVASALALIVGSYYFLQPPAPAPKVNINYQ